MAMEKRCRDSCGEDVQRLAMVGKGSEGPKYRTRSFDGYGESESSSS